MKLHKIFDRLRDDDLMAMDGESAREFDGNGYMHVSTSHLTREQVAPYFGYEIPHYKELGLERERIYYGYRSPDELQKGLATFNGVPLLIRHKMDSAENPNKTERVGTVGTTAEWKSPFLVNSLVLWDKDAIDSVLDGSLRDLSCGYRYKADFTSGKTDDGVAYDFVMRDIRANHVALVAEGRAPECYVEDSLPEPLKDTKMEENEKQGCDSAADALKEVVGRYVQDPEAQQKLLADLAELQKAHHAEEEAESAAVAEAKDEDEPEGEKSAEAKPDEGAKDEDEPKAEEAKDESEGEAKDEDKPAEAEADKPAEAKDEEAPAPEAKPEDEKKSDEGAMDENAIAKRVEARVVSRFRAADAVKPVLGQVDAMAFDSAEDIYLDACKKMGVLSVSKESARDVFLAVAAYKAKSAEGIAMDAKASVGANPALKLLHR